MLLTYMAYMFASLEMHPSHVKLQETVEGKYFGTPPTSELRSLNAVHFHNMILPVSVPCKHFGAVGTLVLLYLHMNSLDMVPFGGFSFECFAASFTVVTSIYMGHVMASQPSLRGIPEAALVAEVVPEMVVHVLVQRIKVVKVLIANDTHV